MQVEDDVFFAFGDLLDHPVDDRAVALAGLVLAALVAAEAEPPVLRQRQPDGVGVPVVKGDLYGAHQLFGVAQPFERRAVDAGEHHLFAAPVFQQVAFDMQLHVGVFVPVKSKHSGTSLFL